MKISGLETVVSKQLAAVMAGKPALTIYAQSAPGVGKSSVIHKVCAEAGVNMIDIRGAQLDPVDLRGLPFVNDKGVMLFSQAGFLPIESRDGKHGVLFLDEIAQAPLAVQNAMLQLVLDRRLGDYVLPDGWLVVAAGNRDIDRAGAGRVTTALGNRMVTVELDCDHEEWHAWAMRNGMRPDIMTFIKRLPQHLHVFDPKQTVNATPRSWEFVNRILEQGHDLDAEHELVEGAVGKGPATAFMGFRKIWKDMPDVNAILDGKKVKCPEKPDIQYATVISLSVILDPEKNLENALNWVQDQLAPEFAAMMIKDLQVRLGRQEFTNKVARTKAFGQWAAKSGQQIMAA